MRSQSKKKKEEEGRDGREDETPKLRLPSLIMLKPVQRRERKGGVILEQLHTHGKKSQSVKKEGDESSAISPLCRLLSLNELQRQ